MNYFDSCANLSEAKARRNELVREFHPDNLTRITQEVNAAYEQVKRDVRADGTLPASYQVRPVQPVMQAAPRIVYRDLIVEVPVYRERIVYRERVDWQAVKCQADRLSEPNDRTCDYSADYFG